MDPKTGRILGTINGGNQPPPQMVRAPTGLPIRMPGIDWVASTGPGLSPSKMPFICTKEMIPIKTSRVGVKKRLYDEISSQLCFTRSACKYSTPTPCRHHSKCSDTTGHVAGSCRLRAPVDGDDEVEAAGHPAETAEGTTTGQLKTARYKCFITFSSTIIHQLLAGKFFLESREQTRCTKR
jgi:hypothetical protein